MFESYFIQGLLYGLYFVFRETKRVETLVEKAYIRQELFCF